MKKFTISSYKYFVLMVSVSLFSPMFGQQLVKDIWAGKGKSSPISFEVFNGKLYFTADDSTHGREIWVTDGTNAGTKLVVDLKGGTATSSPIQLKAFKNHLYFSAAETSKRLFRTDGSTTEDITKFWPSAGINSTDQIETSGGYIYFDGYNSKVGSEIFVSDGTENGTEGKDIYPFKDFGGSPLSSNPDGFTDAGGVLFCNARYQTKGKDPYYVNGKTLKGAVDVNQNLGNSEAGDFTKMGDYIYFSATRDKKTSIGGPDNDEGNELWRVKIGFTSHQLVKNIYTGPYNDANPRNFFNWGDSLIFFSATDGGNVGLWKTDGTKDGTVSVNSGATSPKWFVNFKNEVYFVAQNHLWKTDGTFDGTVEVDNTVSITSPFTKINNRLYFSGSNTANGEELWETDGSKQGTKLIKDIYVGKSSSSPKSFAVLNNTLYFSATDSVKGEELFSYTDTCNAYAGGLNFNGTVSLCTGDSIKLKASSFNTSAVFSWLYNGSNVAANIDSLSANKAGNYRLITNNGNGCIDTSITVVLKWFTKPSRKILTPNGNSMCKGNVDLIDLVPESSTSNYQYQWIEKGVEINNVKDTAIKTNRTSNFQVRITNGGCVITTDTVFTFLHELPVPNIPTSNVSLCTGSKLTLNPGVFDKYLWETSNDTTPTQEVVVAGNYKVTVTDGNSCSASGTFKVVARQKPTVTLAKFGNTFQATSTAGNTFKWLRNGSIINGATQSTYTPTLAGNYSVVATNQFGCSDTTAAQGFVLSIGKLTQQNISVYPNPVINVFTIELENTGVANASITDIQGKELRSFKVKGKTSIDISNLAQGVYYIKISTLENSSTIKLLKQ